jgi:diacylglycerol kinase (ATP)
VFPLIFLSFKFTIYEPSLREARNVIVNIFFAVFNMLLTGNFALWNELFSNIRVILHLCRYKNNLLKMNLREARHEWYVIVNPNAGNKKGQKDWNRIADIFSREGVAIVPVFTKRKGEAIELTRSAIAEGFRNFAVVGGDGTLNEVVNGIFTQEHCPTAEVTVSLIPVGTGNDWGRMFGIPMVYEGAVKVIREKKCLLHDVGLVSYHQGEAAEKRYFLNIAGLGFEALVVKKTNHQKDKGRSNKAIYFYNLLSSLVSYKKTVARITVEGKTTSAKVFSINVGNGRFCGGGMRQTPDALPDDGLLDVTVIREMGRFEIIRNLNLLYDGTILSHSKVDGYRTNKVSIETESLLYAEADGELLGHTPAEFTVIPSALNVVYLNRIIQ